MDVDKLMKNDKLSNLVTRTCTKENDANNCHCAQCLYRNGIANQQKDILNDEKSLTSLPNSLNEESQPTKFTMNNAPNKKLTNPLTSIKNFITSTTGHHNQNATTVTATTNSINKQIDQQNHNSINNHSLNGSINCLNHSIKENCLIKKEIDLNTLHNDEDNMYLNGSNEWYIHCHLNDNSKLNSEKNESANRRLLITTILCGFFLITELIGGYISNSLSIMTDAAHLLSDIVSFGLSLFAVYLSKKRATKRFTFGFQRAEILGAICSILLIWLLTAVVVYFAIVRIITMDFVIESTAMMIVALFGIAVNILMGITLHGCICPGFGRCMKGHSHDEEDGDHYHNSIKQLQNIKYPNDKPHIELEVVSTDTSENGINLNKIDAQNTQKKLAKKTKNDNHESINIRAAIIHVLGDLIQSIGVFVAAVIIHFRPDWKIADPLCTFVFSVIVMFTTVRIMKESLIILMQGSPDNIDHQAVKLNLLNINGVKMVHNLYIWQLTVDNVVLAGHLVVSANCNIEQVLQKARILLKEQHNITHVTMQCERYQPQIMLACDSCNDL